MEPHIEDPRRPRDRRGKKPHNNRNSPGVPLPDAGSPCGIAACELPVVLPGHRPARQPRAGLDVKFLCAFAVML